MQENLDIVNHCVERLDGNQFSTENVFMEIVRDYKRDVFEIMTQKTEHSTVNVSWTSSKNIFSCKIYTILQNFHCHMKYARKR